MVNIYTQKVYNITKYDLGFFKRIVTFAARYAGYSPVV